MATKIFGVDYAAAAALTGAETLSIVQGGAMVDTTTQAIADLAPPQPIADGSITTAKLADGAVTGAKLGAAVNSQTTSYTAGLTDSNGAVVVTDAAANTFTVPPESLVAFPVGTYLEVWQGGAGQTTVTAGTGVTILYHASLTLKLKGQHSGASLRKVAADTWRLVGDMEAAP